jgi:hypothetical protein
VELQFHLTNIKKGQQRLPLQRWAFQNKQLIALLQKSADQLQYRERIGKVCGEDFLQKLDEGEILTGPSDLKLFAGLERARMKELAPFVVKSATFKQAQNEEAEQEADELPSVLRIRLQALFSQRLESARLGSLKLGARTDQYKAAFQKAIAEVTCDELTAFIGYRPATKADLDKIDSGKIDAEIQRCHEHNKNLPGNQEVHISFKDILSARPESGDGQSGKDKEPMSEKGLAATEIILAVIGNGLKEPRQFLAQFAERDLIDWAFPKSFLRTRQIWRTFTPLRSLRKTIEVVDTERLTALNICDLAAWKSNMAGPEVFYIEDSRGLLFMVRIEHPTGAFCELSERDKERFLNIEEAIRRYSREHGLLVNPPAIDELAVPAEAEADISFEESVI